jgi:hypothetical protein
LVGGSLLLSFEGLKYCPATDVPAGNLIYLLRASEPPAIALRVDHPGGAAGTPYPAAIVLRDASQEDRMPLIDPACGKQECVDLRQRATVRWKATLAVVARGTPVSPDPGYLILIQNQVAITSFYAGGRGERQHWDVKTGAHVEVGQNDFCFITAWRLGVNGGDGAFVQLAEYPEDYE